MKKTEMIPDETDFENRLRKLENTLRSEPKKAGVPLLHRENNMIRIGAEFFSGIAVCMLFGIAIDRRWHTYPYGLVAMFLVGICTGFFNVFLIVKRKKK